MVFVCLKKIMQQAFIKARRATVIVSFRSLQGKRWIQNASYKQRQSHECSELLHGEKEVWHVTKSVLVHPLAQTHLCC